MKARALSSDAISAIIALGAAFMIFTPSKVEAVVTSTITGWLVPDAAHLTAGVPIFLFAILFTGFFAMVGRLMGMERQIATFALMGLFAGSLLGVLSLGNSTAGNITPFALPVISGIDLLLFIWMGA